MEVIKRDGTKQPFSADKIYKAIYHCALAHGAETQIVQDLASEVVIELGFGWRESVTVEEIQDAVIRILRDKAGDDFANRYASYRAAHAVERAGDSYADDPFGTELQRFQFFDKYARWNPIARRRETWGETVTRAVDYLKEVSGGKLSEDTYAAIWDGIYKLEVMPSMRLLAMAGPAARAQPLSIYNCSYLTIDSLDSFAEVLLISMSGCGVGYSVESRNVEQLPVIMPRAKTPAGHFIIHDSTEGWVEALRHGLNCWYNGLDVVYDYSLIRPKGAPLKTKGGRASGPEPLRQLLDFTRKTIQGAADRKLSPLECHDIVTMIGSVVVQGGVRRTAMISLFDIDDEEMLGCKDPETIVGHEHRWFANNSAVWTERMSYNQVRSHMERIASTGTGEPGIFSRRAANWTRPSRRQAAEFGTNPCAEISLRPMGLCNLSIVVARSGDDVFSLMRKVELATIIGTIQSMVTNFKGLRKQWRTNCEEERLLGVDITGQLDCPAAQDGTTLSLLRQRAIEVNRAYARMLGINQSAAVTCVKPSGNSSVLLDASPGIHPRHAPYYIRRVRVSATSPLYHVLKHSGVKMTPENGQTREDASTWVVEFPVKSPLGAVTKKQRSALVQLEYWLKVKRFFTEHNPSATITFRQSEVADIAKFIYYHQERVGGLSFLPADESDVVYEQLPYEEITAAEYEQRLEEMPAVDYSWLPIYETTDSTTVAQELACVSGLCEI